MLEVLKNEANRAYTENGAVSLRTTGKDCLDFFATVGALRRESEEEINTRFMRAYAEEPDLAMKILFYARDVRGGLGERRVFRSALVWLANNARASVLRNLPFIAEYGRWDDVLVLLDTPCRSAALELIKERFAADMAELDGSGDVSLLGKWLPSANASNRDTVRRAKMLVKALGIEEREYRKALTRLRARIRIIENNLRERDYSFDYAKQPSRAMLKYRRAFIRNDGERYGAYLESVRRGEATLHTGALYPYDIVEKARRCGEDEAPVLDTMWNALEDFTTGENALVVADGSGSMYWQQQPSPASVAQSLAIYFAERCTGAFSGHFITFSTRPQLVKIQGRNIVEKIRYCESFNECANTDIAAVFDLLLGAAVRNRVPQGDMPSKLYIISDMEFDACADNAYGTNFERAKRAFAAAGYRLPQLVFWNVASRSRQQPVSMNERGVTLVSGCSPRIFSMAMDDALNPYEYMLSVVGAERYAPIAA